MAWNPEADSVVIPRGTWNPDADSTIQQNAPSQSDGEIPTKRTLTWADVVSPANAKAQREGKGVASKEWAALKDFLTLPGRAAFAATQGAGELAGSGDIGQAVEAAKQAGANPVESFEESAPNMPTAQKYLASPRQFAEMASDPLAIPGAYLGSSAMKPIAQGLVGSVAAYAKRQADAIANGETTGAGMTMGEYIPAALGAGVAAIPVVGGRLQSGANELFRRTIKPVRAEVEGLVDALKAGKLPELAGWSATAGGAGENFLKKLGKIGEQYPEVLKAADATGEKVSTFNIYDRAKDALYQEMADRGLTLSPAEAGGALDWLRSRVRLPESKEGIRAVMSGKSVPANDISPTLAHRLKSALYDIAFGKEADAAVPRAAKISLAKSASKEARKQLNEISPEYAALNREAAPLYGAEDAMARAAEVRGNNYHFGGLDVAGLGIPIALRTPAVHRAIWEAGKGAERLTPLAKRLAPLVASPGDQTRLGRR